MEYTSSDNVSKKDGGQASGATYSVALSALPLLGSDLMVTSALNQVWAKKITVIQNAGDYTLQLSVPASMPFGTHTIAPPGTLYPRQSTIWSISVTGDRIDKAAWELHVAVQSPLSGTDGSGTPRIIEDALVYNNQGVVTVLGHASFPIHVQSAGGPQQTNLDWLNNEGVLVQAPQTLYEGTYSATQQWTLVDGP